MAKPNLRDVYRGSLTGNYTLLDGPTRNRRLAVLTWGTSELLNNEIAMLGSERAVDSTETFTDENGAPYLSSHGLTPIVISGVISNKLFGSRPGLRGIFKGIKEQMDSADERPPLEIVTHARVAGRAALEAWQEGLDPIVRPGMPARIIKNDQIWTSSEIAWDMYDLAVITQRVTGNMVRRVRMLHW